MDINKRPSPNSTHACRDPEVPTARIRSIVAELTTPIMAEWFEALKSSHKMHKLESDHDSPSSSRRADPEPEPEMVDLKRLEARQEESRQALEELQQQLCEIQRHEGPDDSSIKLRLSEVGGRAKLLELDESLKSDLKARSPSSQVRELCTRLDVVSAEAARSPRARTRMEVNSPTCAKSWNAWTAKSASCHAMSDEPCARCAHTRRRHGCKNSHRS